MRTLTFEEKLKAIETLASLNEQYQKLLELEKKVPITRYEDLFLYISISAFSCDVYTQLFESLIAALKRAIERQKFEIEQEINQTLLQAEKLKNIKTLTSLSERYKELLELEKKVSKTLQDYRIPSHPGYKKPNPDSFYYTFSGYLNCKAFSGAVKTQFFESLLTAIKIAIERQKFETGRKIDQIQSQVAKSEGKVH
jgi:hypothetical protein